MIQIITGADEKRSVYSDITKYVVNDFNSPEAFDQYDVNILDLSFDTLWRNKLNDTNSVDMINDIKHYKRIIENTQISKIVVIFPQNIGFYLNYYSGKYNGFEHLKNLTWLIKKIVKENINDFVFELDFEKTTTKLENVEVKADFHFSKEYLDEEHSILFSDKSRKITTIKVTDKLYYTTLDVSNSSEMLEQFLISSNIINMSKTDIPSWVEDYDILDDKVIKEELKQIDEVIYQNQLKKEEMSKKLEMNNDIKSILYETGKKLQNKVNELLNEMLDYCDDNFIDKMEEDYRIEKENITFIIETKGLKRNVSGSDVSKTFNHVIMYEEKLQEVEVAKNIKGLLIVTIQGDKPIGAREKIHNRQIEIANRNNILIIRTEQLLKLFEDFRNKKITTEKIIEIFSNEKGELVYNE